MRSKLLAKNKERKFLKKNDSVIAKELEKDTRLKARNVKNRASKLRRKIREQNPTFTPEKIEHEMKFRWKYDFHAKNIVDKGNTLCGALIFLGARTIRDSRVNCPECRIKMKVLNER